MKSQTSMASTPKRRLINPKTTKRTSNPFPSSSPSIFIEPSPNLFPSKSECLRLMAVLTIAASVAIGCNFFIVHFRRHPKPFCDSSSEFDDSLSDVCEPCPSNGECHEGKLECLDGYRRHGKSCLEDGDINETAKKLAKMLEVQVCESYVQYVCKGSGTVWVHSEELWNNVGQLNLMQQYGPGNPIYEFGKQRALEIVGKSLEMRENSQGIKELKCPELLMEHYKPLTCYIQQWFVEHALFLLPFCALLLACSFILLKVRQRHNLSVRVDQLYEEVCNILEENALISRSVNGEGEPWVVASWLRDHLLSPRERRDPLLWKKVEELVEEDSRLDRYPKMVKGESKVVWEWQVEGSVISSGKRKKGEVSKQKLGVDKDLRYNQRQSAAKAGEPLSF